MKMVVPAMIHILALASAVLAATPSADKMEESAEAKMASKPEPIKVSKKKSTEMSFEDVLVQGKYHFADEAVTTVEEDKVLDGLLGVRSDFKDRMKKSASRH